MTIKSVTIKSRDNSNNSNCIKKASNRTRTAQNFKKLIRIKRGMARG